VEDSGDETLKCLVWDLDETLWIGALLEGAPGVLREGVREVVEALDRRGVVQSVASNGDPILSHARLRELGLAQYFLHPQIQLAIDKPHALRRIAGQLGIALRHCALVDDDAFQRAYMTWMAPEVRVYDAGDVATLLARRKLPPEAATAEAASRRALYVAEAERRAEEARFRGSRAEFLASCKMELTIRPASSADVPRIAELLSRTHRMHASFAPMTDVELARTVGDPSRPMYIAALADTFGSHGIVACVVLDAKPDALGIGAFAMSCRVLGRGVGESLLTWVLCEAAARGAAQVRVGYRITDENVGIRLLLASLRFDVIEVSGEVASFRHRLVDIPPYPEFLAVSAP
jgi:methoxymalonate biosynthesis protein